MIRNWLRNFMIGRYGPDHLSLALILTAIVIGLIGSIIRMFVPALVGYPISIVLSVLSYVFLALGIFRSLSRNIPRRRAENDRFLRFWWPFKQKVKLWIARQKSRKTHKYFKCPSCKNTLRVPRGKGKIQVTCPKCGERFIQKT
jgi:predicted RNA-binding Zn-ribbon protein involved in translation (DUF1610 family)